MLTLPPKLKEAAEAEMKKQCWMPSDFTGPHNCWDPGFGIDGAWMNGVQWLYSHLMKSESEFDADAYQVEADKIPLSVWLSLPKTSGGLMARWQFEQDKAKIAALEAENDMLRINAAEYYGVRP